MEFLAGLGIGMAAGMAAGAIAVITVCLCLSKMNEEDRDGEEL